VIFVSVALLPVYLFALFSISFLSATIFSLSLYCLAFQLSFVFSSSLYLSPCLLPYPYQHLSFFDFSAVLYFSDLPFDQLLQKTESKKTNNRLPSAAGFTHSADEAPTVKKSTI
jgi:hypothetical protein